MNVKQITNNKTKVMSAGMNDVVIDGVLIKDMPAPSVLVTAQTELATLPAYPPGTIAYMAGAKAMWQLDPSGNWVSFL